MSARELDVLGLKVAMRRTATETASKPQPQPARPLVQQIKALDIRLTADIARVEQSLLDLRRPSGDEGCQRGGLVQRQDDMARLMSLLGRIQSHLDQEVSARIKTTDEIQERVRALAELAKTESVERSMLSEDVQRFTVGDFSSSVMTGVGGKSLQALADSNHLTVQDLINALQKEVSERLFEDAAIRAEAMDIEERLASRNKGNEMDRGVLLNFEAQTAKQLSELSIHGGNLWMARVADQESFKAACKWFEQAQQRCCEELQEERDARQSMHGEMWSALADIATQVTRIRQEASADKAGYIEEIAGVRNALANFDQAVVQQFREYQANREEEPIYRSAVATQSSTRRRTAWVDSNR
eukprot:NODE_601_length_1452_cov_286.948461.p1 GENE.NODE_601_length_1452_cov_286.948461~~NODE_601_length_1452_cov_286.948461.p1  ORF type:complete len:403 (-),score=110.69 NODE_601_length_1452_cov_286.948461:242-1312(-)